jgi:hypothetical protein
LKHIINYMLLFRDIIGQSQVLSASESLNIQESCMIFARVIFNFGQIDFISTKLCEIVNDPQSFDCQIKLKLFCPSLKLKHSHCSRRVIVNQ